MADEEIDEVEEDDEIPESFVKDIATRIVILFEKSMDPVVAGGDVVKFIQETTGTEERIPYFVDALEVIIDNVSLEKFGAMTWVALLKQASNEEIYDEFIHALLHEMIRGYYELEKPDIEFLHKTYSAYAAIIARIFLKMIDLNESNSEHASEYYALLVRKEISWDESGGDEDEDDDDSAPKLFDGVLSYLTARSNMKEVAIGSDDTREHISMLTEKLRGSKRYVIQDIANQRALEKKKRIEQEMEARLASAEEIVMAASPFSEGLALFVKEKRFNYKFLAVEKVRMTLQLTAGLMGIIYFMMGFMNYGGITWGSGLFVCIALILFGKIAASRARFQAFYPKDVSKELEQHATDFINVMRRMSSEQLEQFLVRQIKNADNFKNLAVVAEFLKYLFAIMPDRKSMIITIDELSDLVENTAIEISKQIRSAV